MLVSRILAPFCALALLACAAPAERRPNDGYFADYDLLYRADEFILAADTRDVPVHVHGAAQGWFGAMAVTGLAGDDDDARIAYDTVLSDDPQIGVRLPYRLILVANPAHALTGAGLCRGQVPATLGRTGDRLVIHAVFCRAAKPLAEIAGVSNHPMATTEDGFQAIIGDLTTLLANPRPEIAAQRDES